MTQPVVRDGPTLFFDEPEPHGFWLAMNWVFWDVPICRENSPLDCFLIRSNP